MVDIMRVRKIKKVVKGKTVRGFQAGKGKPYYGRGSKYKAIKSGEAAKNKK